LLQGAGYEVSTAESGDEGIERAKQIKPDLSSWTW
jgi:CheY-like chemotaxis protein